jgi:alkanesulfonate monooxygenase SsuD/methylene tetrahydromethanopterin reductase-like flavin-dependent oxidoreductase (luciferase family)
MPKGEDEHTVFQQALEQGELADKLGFDCWWQVEHHFLEEYAHSSAPEVFLAALSQRTKNIRLGHGIVAALPAYNHPARIAERLGTLDLVSNGRVEFGSGETASSSELDGFGIDRTTKRQQWEEVVPQIARMMYQEPYPGFQGEYFSMPARNVIPKPLQKPHPPLWVACSQKSTIEMAGERGIGALSFAFIETDEAREYVDLYYNALERCTNPLGLAANANIAIVTGLLCHEDEQTALDRGVDGFHFFFYTLQHFYLFGTHEPARTNLKEDFDLNREERGLRPLTATGKPLTTRQNDSLRGAIGTPDQIIEYLRRFEEAGVDEVIFFGKAGSTKHEWVCESMELFAKEVMPEFKERRPQAQARKAERLAPVLERIERHIDVEKHPEAEPVIAFPEKAYLEKYGNIGALAQKK